MMSTFLRLLFSRILGLALDSGPYDDSQICDISRFGTWKNENGSDCMCIGPTRMHEIRFAGPIASPLCTEIDSEPFSHDPLNVSCSGDPLWRVGQRWCTCVDSRSSCNFYDTCDASRYGGWNDGCNRCVCGAWQHLYGGPENGPIGGAICTRMGCEQYGDPTNATCWGDPLWQVGPKWCTCVDGKSLCDGS